MKRKKKNRIIIHDYMETITDKFTAVNSMLTEIEKHMTGINDYGEATGLREKHDAIVNDFHAMISSIRARSYRLQKRLRLNSATQ